MAYEPVPASIQRRIGQPRKRTNPFVKVIATLSVIGTCGILTAGTAYAVGYRPIAGPVDRVIRAVTDRPRTDAPLSPQPTLSQPQGLNDELIRRFAKAQAAAAERGYDLTITSGYRSWQTQQRLYEEAIATHGSAAEARKWVLPPDESAHVRGMAIDVAPRRAARWLERNGETYGLCRVYKNEWWHFEPLVEPGGTCPELKATAA